MTAIKMKNLTKKFKNQTAVDGLNLSVEQGELFSLLGVNGAGKTTTVKMLCCLAKPDDGEAFICGKSIEKERSDVKKLIGISPQETAVAQSLTVKENLEMFCGFYSYSKSDAEKKTKELAGKFGLNDVINKKAGKLSGGFQRRLSIAMALIGEPAVLFLDEPTLGLDVIARSDLWEIIRQLKGRVTIVLTTHYMEEAEALSDRVGVMKDGRLLFTGTVDEIKRKTHKEKFEEAFLSVVKGETE